MSEALINAVKKGNVEKVKALVAQELDLFAETNSVRQCYVQFPHQETENWSSGF